MALPPLLLTPEGIQAAVHGAPRNRGETVSVQTLFGILLKIVPTAQAASSSV